MGLFSRHKHNWKKVHETFTPPVGGKWSVKGLYEEGTLLKLTYGFTTVQFVCQDPDCNKATTEVHLGDQRTNN